MSRGIPYVWQCQRLIHDVVEPVLSARALLDAVQAAPVWDVTGVQPVDEQFPLMHLNWHAGHGFVIQCYEDEAAWSDFLTIGPIVSRPSVDVELGGQALERWPVELFIPLETAHVALEHFLVTGQENRAQQWVRIDKFPRTIVWEGREGREAWERARGGQ